ncbi:uncharacterized protein LOC132718163 [Ruditapes philippinarum]|uniref:uncharacterized protein LOC132718163 n=1 Tax=Ruditapes philippinarum TaxID=129788 RepID=UPI00295B152A|nr:uncharacterized protein LOC132718163 [Ruditapes philippinarum]
MNKSNEIRPELSHINNTMQGANGHGIEIFGMVNTTLQLGNGNFEVSIIVCDIVPGGILGQDFLLCNASNIDFRKPIIYTDKTPISCWIFGQAEARCSVLTYHEVTIPASSFVQTSVKIENVGSSANLAIISTSNSLVYGKTTVAVEEVLEPHTEEPYFFIVNTSDSDKVIPKNVPVGVCKSYYEVKDAAIIASRNINIGAHTENENNEISTYLQDLFDRSKTELTDDQADQLSKLLKQYQHIFAKSSDDLGMNKSEQHKINTGSAAPIPQPPRRQPLGERDTEKQEVNKMLSKSVIEPSISNWSSPTVLVTKKDGSTR